MIRFGTEWGYDRMGIFSRNQGEKHNNIASVVLIEQTQKYKNRTSWGLSFPHFLNDSAMI